MKLYVAGICGTFMGSLAMLARELGHEVKGCDAGIYPPMSEQLSNAGIGIDQGYDPRHLAWQPDLTLIGNALTRGNPLVEHVLRERVPFTSGPGWLHDHVLPSRRVIAVAGTHGKTTTASMLTWILQDAHLAPGYLIGGAPLNLDVSARVGRGELFVIEADEYDSAFFDKRSKFVHYQPNVLVINNIEFDHADIFDDMVAIRRTFHHVVRLVPDDGTIIHRADDAETDRVLAMGCWTPRVDFGLSAGEWQAKLFEPDATRLGIHRKGTWIANIENPVLFGRHNANNALAAIAAADRAGVDATTACAALSRFRGVRRRMELRGAVAGIDVYDDFAHHPTAIAVTLEGLRATVGRRRIIAVLDPASNTMKRGVHRHTLGGALRAADRIVLRQPPGVATDMSEISAEIGPSASTCASVDDIIATVTAEAYPGDCVVIMSNGGFGGIHERLLASLVERFGDPNG